MNTPARAWYGMTATLMGLGTRSKMPGTLGTAAALFFFMLTGYNGIPLIVFIAAIGAVAADKYARAVSRDDPGEVVIDEVAGFFVSVWGLGRSFGLVGFFLFRIVDILKPFPVRHMEKLPGGIGIMADDICGGIMVNLMLRALQWLFFADGLEAVFGFFGVGV